MDNHQRKQLARWETKKAKGHVKFEEKVRGSFHDPARDKVEAFAKSYTPPPWVLCGLIKEANDELEDLRYPLRPRVRYVRDDSVYWRSYHIVASGKVSRLLRFGPEKVANSEPWLVYDERSLERRLDVRKTRSAIRAHKNTEVWNECLDGIVRSALRLNRFRDELQQVYPRWRAVLNCKAIKEDLMMNVWHPRRVEHILTTYGWEAYENLLGEE